MDQPQSHVSMCVGSVFQCSDRMMFHVVQSRVFQCSLQSHIFHCVRDHVVFIVAICVFVLDVQSMLCQRIDRIMFHVVQSNLC